MISQVVCFFRLFAVRAKRQSINKYESKQRNCFKLKADFIMGLDLNVITNHISKLGHLNKSLYRVKNPTLHEMHWLERWSEQPLEMKPDTFISSCKPKQGKYAYKLRPPLLYRASVTQRRGKNTRSRNESKEMKRKGNYIQVIKPGCKFIFSVGDVI